MHTLSPQDRAAAILSLGLVAAIAVFVVVSLATAMVLIGKGGVLAFEALDSAAATYLAQKIR